MTLSDLTAACQAFDLERNRHLHPEDLAKSIMIEGAELLEHRQRDAWHTYIGTTPPKDLEKIRLEMADVAIYLLKLSYILDVNLEQAITDKLAITARKFPVGYNVDGDHEAYLRIKKERREKEQE